MRVAGRALPRNGKATDPFDLDRFRRAPDGAPADPLTRDIEALVLCVLDTGQRRQLLAMLDTLADWLHSDFSRALAERYPELTTPARSDDKAPP